MLYAHKCFQLLNTEKPRRKTSQHITALHSTEQFENIYWPHFPPWGKAQRSMKVCIQSFCQLSWKRPYHPLRGSIGLKIDPPPFFHNPTPPCQVSSKSNEGTHWKRCENPFWKTHRLAHWISTKSVGSQVFIFPKFWNSCDLSRFSLVRFGPKTIPYSCGSS